MIYYDALKKVISSSTWSIILLYFSPIIAFWNVTLVISDISFHVWLNFISKRKILKVSHNTVDNLLQCITYFVNCLNNQVNLLETYTGTQDILILNSFPWGKSRLQFSVMCGKHCNWNQLLPHYQISAANNISFSPFEVHFPHRYSALYLVFSL